MAEKQEYAEGKQDLEKSGTISVADTLDSADTEDEKLRALGEKNPHYVHDLTWTAEEEKALVRIFDFKVLSWIGVMFFFLQLDRGNMSNALTDNIMGDLGVNLNTMTLGTTVFVLFFVAFEIPSNIIIRRVGPHRWIPFLMFFWGVATACQALLKDKASFLITRALVGLFEAGYIPGIAIYLTTYYKKGEMALRLSVFWSTLAIANSVAGVLAYGILHMRGIAGLAGWKWLFLIEGVATSIIGILSFFILPEGPLATKGYLRFNGYLTERQELIAITRLVRDDPAKADTGKKVVPPKEVLKALLSPKVWPNILIGFFGLMPSAPLGGFAPLMIKNFGFDALTSNVMTIPGYFLSFAIMSLVSYSSDKRNERAFHGAIATTYYAVCVLALALLPADSNKYSLYFCLIFTIGAQTAWHPINAAWIASNTAPVGKRTIALAMYIMSVNLCAIPGSNIFRAEDSPRFINGMWILFGFLVLTIFLFLFQRQHLLWHNKRRDALTKDWTAEDWKKYDADGEDKGDEDLRFRYLT